MNSIDQNKEIFFHVGLGKTASTYLQYQVFPKLKGVYYIQRTQYRHAKEIIANTQHSKYLISYECDEQLEDVVDDFSATYPQTKGILVLRQQDQWIASQYRRFVKNARPHSFQDFFDIEHDRGAWKQKTMFFYPKIQYLEQHFQGRPLVLFHEDLKKSPLRFIDQMVSFLNVQYSPGQISLKPVHKSYNENQLKVMRWLSRYTYQGERENPKSRFLKYLRHYLYVAPLRYSVLYGALLVPPFAISKEDLIPPDQLEKIRAFYREDWEKCLAYAQSSAPAST
ncbi:MAG: hypothetical protein HC880_06135 [Bacteroidia bacterium]|nr:hypothetical protein [Bacteroidia bacterium]